MTSGPIRSLPHVRVERRDDVRLSAAWIDRGADEAAPSGLHTLSRMAREPERSGPGEVVLVMLGTDAGQAERELLVHARAGARVYVIAPLQWKGGEHVRHLLDAPTVLVRKVPEPPASAVHTRKDARVWIGGGWCLHLDGAQAEALRQVFLYAFWHEATEEAWSDGRRFEWRAAAACPFDVPVVAPDAPVQIVEATRRLEPDGDDAFVHVTTGAVPGHQLRRLWIRPGLVEHERLAALARQGTQVSWQDRGLPNIALGSGRGELLVLGRFAGLRIQLRGAQIGDARTLLAAPARWRFAVDVRLGDPEYANASLWLVGQAGARKLEAEQRIELPVVFARSLRAVPTAEPGQWPGPQPLALTVRYCWTVQPPAAPRGHVTDPLVTRWQAIDADWELRVDRVDVALQQAKRERGRLEIAWQTLARVMLGLGREQNEIADKLQKLRSRRPSELGPSEAEVVLEQLGKLETEVDALLGKLDDSEQKALEQQAHAEQLGQWKATRAANEQQLVEKREVLDRGQQRLAEVGEQLSDVENRLKTATPPEHKDLRVAKQKLSDERARLERDSSRIGDEITALERQIEQEFEFQPPARKSTQSRRGRGRFVPEASRRSSNIAIPDEALPEIGSLREQDGRRYLVIDSWEQLERGEQIAARYQAELVGPDTP